MRPEVTAVVIDDLPRARWCVGGRTVEGATAPLEIGITAGTNTGEEKARFIAAAFDELQRQLAPDGVFEVASYVTVRELPATAWGHGGQTQRARQQARSTVTMVWRACIRLCPPKPAPKSVTGPAKPGGGLGSRRPPEPLPAA